jgi:hypothetical protein
MNRFTAIHGMNAFVGVVSGLHFGYEVYSAVNNYIFLLKIGDKIPAYKSGIQELEKKWEEVSYAISKLIN